MNPALVIIVLFALFALAVGLSLAVLFGLVALFFVMADFVTDLWWYRASRSPR